MVRRPGRAWLAIVLVLLAACAGRGAPGPRFGTDDADRRPAPPGSGVLYVHRADAVPTSGRARLRIPGHLRATLDDREYLRVNLPAGRYELSLQFRGLPWAWGWDTVPFQIRSGQVRYLRLQAIAARTPQRGGHRPEDTSPGSERVEVTLARGFVEATAALAELRSCRLTPDLALGG